jgi:hypothetical protein
MSWLGFLKLLLTVANTVSKIVHDQQLLGAGEGRAVAKSLASLSQRLGIANAVAEEVAALSNADLDADLRGD